MNLGLIGNCQYSALVSHTGEVQWLCWPRFDSSFVFGSLLDDKLGGECSVTPGAGKTIGKQRYITNTNVLVTTFSSQDGQFEVIDFAPRFFTNDCYYKPTALIRIVRPIVGQPRVRIVCEPCYDYGRQRLTPILGSQCIRYVDAHQPLRLCTNASQALILERRPFVLTESIYLMLTWGDVQEMPLRNTCEDYLNRTISYWRGWVKHCLLPMEFQNEVIRSALVLKLHQYEDTGAIIAATTMGIPEARDTNRIWDYRYCWLRDAHFTVTALMKLTHFEELEGFEAFIRNVLENSSGEALQPVYSISGEPTLTESTLDHLTGYRGHRPVRLGNQAFEHKQHDLYGELILAVSPTFYDMRFADHDPEMKRHLLHRLLRLIERHIEDADAGLWEFRGRSALHAFSLLLHWAGARAAEQVGARFGLEEIRKLGETLKDKSAQMLTERFWCEDIGAYVQSESSRDLDASLLMMINMGFLRSEDPRAKSHLLAIKAGLKTSTGLIYRYRVIDDFGQTTNAFTICSFWLVEAYARLGYPNEARALFEELCGCANPLGLFSEDLDPSTREQWGNFPQAYSHVGLINAAFAVSKTWD